MQASRERVSHCVLFLSLMLFGLGGCARLTSIYRSGEIPVDAPHIVSIDAKQRMLLTSPVKESADVAARLRFCAEPPPDVFTALAASLGAEASVGQGADPAAAAKLASSISENASTVERSQTINILREAMYRNCERYLNGALDREEFIIQAARDQQLIVQVLAIEQITGAARAQATALTTVAKSAASGVTDTGLETLAAAKKDLEAKRTLSDKATNDAKALVPPGACPATPYDAGTPPTGSTAAQVTAKNEACAAAKAAEARTTESKAYLATVQEAVARQSEVSSQVQGTATSAAFQAAAMNEAVARQIVDIVKQNHAFDEIGMTCVVKMRKLKNGEELPNYCVTILNKLFETRQAQLLIAEGLDPKQVQIFTEGLVQEARSNAAVVWDYLAKNGGVTSQSLEALATAGKVRIPDTTLSALAVADSQEAFARVFQRLSNPTQNGLRLAAGGANTEKP